ncbi:MAG: beta strand repeat-containing protein [Acidimicrobiales bacterium]
MLTRIVSLLTTFSGKTSALPRRPRRSGRRLGALLATSAIVLAVLWQPLPAAAAGVDSDGDLVNDDVDIDDDNDGILDIDESEADFQWATYNPISGTSATGSINSTSFTYTSSTTILTTTAMYGHANFPASYNVPDANPTIKNEVSSTNTITFSQPVLNPMVVFSSIGNPSTPVPVQFDRDVEVLWSVDTTIDSPSRITGNEGFAILQVPGEHSSFSFDYLANEIYVNFAFGADPRQGTNSDSDSVLDHLDLDSDNDGITDNVEAQTTADYIAPSGVDSDGNGLDDAYESTPGAGEGLTPVNTEGTGEADVLDADSDDDGTDDIAERDDGQPTSVTSLVDTDSDGLLDIFEGADANDGYDPNDENRTQTTINLASDLALDADGTNAAPPSIDILFRDSVATTDTDLDGIPDTIEIGADSNNPINTDGLGQPDYLDTDADDDGIADSVERGIDVTSVDFAADTDDDGIPDAMDVTITAGADANSDGMDDTFSPVDTDSDGAADFVDTDSDNDGTPDATDPNRLAAVASADTGSTSQAVPVTIDVLTNDDFTAAASISITDLGTGSGTGSITSTPASGEVTYAPQATETGDVTVNYRACNTAVAPTVCADATVTVSITPDSDFDGNPDATDPNPSVVTTDDDTGSTIQGVSVTVDVLANDDFIAGSTVGLTDLGTGTATGTVTANAVSGDIIYVPAASETGDVTVDYRACNTAVSPSVCADAVLTISIATDTDGDGSPDSADSDDDNDGNPDVTDLNPLVATAVDDSGSTVQGVSLTVDVLANDDFIAAGSISLTDLGTGTASGTVTTSPTTGELTYAPVTSETGDVTIDYRACNTAASPSVCADALLSVSIATDTDGDGSPDSADTDDDNDGNPDSTDPNPSMVVAADDTASMLQAVLVAIDVLANDDFTPGNSISITDLGTGTATGTVTISPASGEIRYAPAASETGDVTIDYRACNTAVTPASCADATVTVSITPDGDLDGNPDSTDPNPSAATAVDDTGSTVQGASLTIDVLANDDFTLSNATTITDLGTGTATGTITTDPATGELTYVPAEGETGDVTVAYQVCNTTVSPAACDSATVTISITALTTITGRIYRDLDRDGVIDDNEVDISGVDVWLMSAGTDEAFGTDDDIRVATATTASPFVFPAVPAGTYRITVDVSTLPPGIDVTDDWDGGNDQAVTVSADGDPVDLHLGQNYRAISGVARDVDGNPLPNTSVTVTDDAGNTFTVTTNDDGSFFVEGSEQAPLAGGDATVSMVDSSGQTVTTSVSVSGGLEPVVTVIAATPSIPTELAYTGTTPMGLVYPALGLILGGALLIQLNQRNGVWQRRFHGSS